MQGQGSNSSGTSEFRLPNRIPRRHTKVIEKHITSDCITSIGGTACSKQTPTPTDCGVDKVIRSIFQARHVMLGTCEENKILSRILPGAKGTPRFLNDDAVDREAPEAVELAGRCSEHGLVSYGRPRCDGTRPQSRRPVFSRPPVEHIY